MSGSDQQTKSVAPNSAVAVGPFLALFGHAAVFAECPLLRDERTKLRRGPRSEFDPKETLALTSTPSKETLVELGSLGATAIWERTNLANLEENILPTRPRATLILTKGADHVIETVALRRL